MQIPITKFVQYKLGYEYQWNTYDIVIPRGCCVICRTDDDTDLMMKLGDGIHKFRDLPIFMMWSFITSTGKLTHFDIDESKIDHLLYIDENSNIAVSDFTEVTITDILTSSVTADFKLSILPPIISAPSIVHPGLDIKLKADVYTVFTMFDIPIEYIEWTLPDNTKISKQLNEELEYTINHDSSVIGTSITFYAKAYGKYGIESRRTKHDINIITDKYDPYVIETSVEEIS
jgi:hypothetical protein